MALSVCPHSSPFPSLLSLCIFLHYLSSVSIIGWFIISVLIFSEVNQYLSPRPKEHMVVDTTLGQKLKININISFHSLTCAEVRAARPNVYLILSLSSPSLLRCTSMQWTWRGTTN
jgi:hypothetical protein